MVAGTGSPSTVYPSTLEERGTVPQSSGRICGEDSFEEIWLFTMLPLEQEYTGSGLGRDREHWQSWESEGTAAQGGHHFLWTSRCG